MTLTDKMKYCNTAPAQGMTTIDTKVHTLNFQMLLQSHCPKQEAAQKQCHISHCPKRKLLFFFNGTIYIFFENVCICTTIQRIGVSEIFEN